jgi:undecaprenyl-diphosphatase
MITTLQALDTRIFLFLNGIHSPFFDQVMWYVSAKFTWIPLYLFILGWLYLRYKRRFLLLLLFIPLLVLVSDQVSVRLFKDVFHRLRPCHQPDLQSLVHLVKGHCGGMYGFVSSHAANTFAVAMFTSRLIRNKTFTWIIFLWALLSGYSRIYLGVHYPGDILAGSLVGTGIGYLTWLCWHGTDRYAVRKLPWFAPSSSDHQT